MAKVRIYELAKELEVSSKELINVLFEEFSIKAKNHMSVIEEEDAELIKELYSDENSGLKDNKNETVEHYENLANEDANKVVIRKRGRKGRDELGSGNNAVEPIDDEVVVIESTITVKDLADTLKRPYVEVIKQLIFIGVMAGMNQEIDFATAEKVIEKYGALAVLKDLEEGKIADDEDIEENDAELGTDKKPAVVTVMGHVDHGKTSLLDCIRKSKVTETEAGGITQHIGAYTVNINGEKITFLDTPGHEAFTAMRARGAQITDIVILVVAADDGIMPQTEEAINHCKAAGVPMIVAINKIDRPGANIDKVKQELTEHGLVAEDWGGDTICVPVSAHTKEGIDTLLEMILITAEMLELKANTKRHAKGTVIEGKLDKGRGPLATLLVQNGTLHTGDSIIVGSTYGRIRAMFDDKGKKIKTAGPSIPVEILGLSDVPSAGDRFNVIKDEKTARNMAEARKTNLREEHFQASNRVSMENLYNQIQEGSVKELGVIVKADVQGSVEAVRQSLEKLSTDNVKVRVIHSGVGAITETDVVLAAASNAIIIGFNVRPDNNAAIVGEKEKVEIKTYRIIYDALDDIKLAMLGMLDPVYKEVVLGRVEIRQIYKVSNVGTIAGSYVLTGKITRNSSVRVLRNGIVITESTLASLKRFKDDAKEVAAGFECGLSVEKFNDLKEGDIIEAFIMEEIKPKLV
ncbi:translation initiation factor IF-2 [Clostridium estertheticum]|uniref:Translation initiation factor IF-2 n=1 Tax=Clostridium estertheticum subsp. estertheticum TaxID=1552 RepID=A0A1J0GHX3_9CLOT|nr:translation initiation factor IF-2 [Clostridium estertheticum]APC40915.1 translation initiation factor IF-2 [Clostridium estertheticum subsp. estertheticum]MBU3073972.1 translation initiation factor IF-2 [Clostridium estertheticum]MBU3164066.1 translation initiation factor IF-2 [Clostridium estertheticum]MBZ9617222.1 translation initiation factor IF-2 [Clostridium estertheticum subsp. laramiense]WAG72912.1 translation initiation factor IF-2 [Clostridium estertheticum]